MRTIIRPEVAELRQPNRPANTSAHAPLTSLRQLKQPRDQNADGNSVTRVPNRLFAEAEEFSFEIYDPTNGVRVTKHYHGAPLPPALHTPLLAKTSAAPQGAKPKKPSHNYGGTREQLAVRKQFR